VLTGKAQQSSLLIRSERLQPEQITPYENLPKWGWGMGTVIMQICCKLKLLDTSMDADIFH